LDALLHAGRIGVDVAIACLAESDVVEHLVRALHRVGGGEPRDLAAVGHERHGVHARDVRVVFRHVADAGADGERRLRHVETEHGHAAAVRLHEAEQRLEHRALARAVRPEQADGPFGECSGDVLEGLVLSVDDGYVIQLYDFVHFRSLAYTEIWRTAFRDFPAAPAHPRAPA